MSAAGDCDPLDGAVIADRLKALAAFTDVPGEMTRLTLSPSHKAAAAQVAEWFRAAGLDDVHMDGTGSIVGRYRSGRNDARTLILGSHIDTVRNAGIYDGNLGVLVALAAIAALSRAGRRLPVDLELVAFADEEGVRFPSTLSSSRARAGTFDPACLDEVDGAGITRRAALEAFGAPVDSIPAAACDPARTLGYVEVHIEQGPVLEARDAPLGIVTGIAGSSRGRCVVQGQAGHAGTLPMAMRRDALTAAAEMLLAVERRAVRDGGADGLVATVGVLDIPGAAVNVVAGTASFSLDVRAGTDGTRLAAVADIEREIAAIAARRGVAAELQWTHAAPAAPCDADLKARLGAAIQGLGLPVTALPSGAGHDAMVFRGVAPMAMLFVRSRNGSHNPREFAAPADIGLAARALHAFLLGLSE